MANDSTDRVFVELYDAPLTDRPDDRTGRVVTSAFAAIDDLVNDAVIGRTDLNPVTLRAAYDLLHECALRRILRGDRVEFGLGIIHLECNGIFIGDHARWDNKINRLVARLLPGFDLRKALKNVLVEVLGKAQIPNYINSATDVASGGTVNSIITPGGIINLSGVKMKIAGDHPAIGIDLQLDQSSQSFHIPMNAIGTNEPTHITFVAPLNLPAGDYRLTITTQYSGGGKFLKEPRVLTLSYLLTV
jgi:hypothetical protein